MKGSVIMIIRQLKEKQFEQFQSSLAKNAHTEPLEACYTINMTINSAVYAVKVQPERQNKIAVLQALRIRRGETGTDIELVTRGSLLSSLLEILIDQGIAQ